MIFFYCLLGLILLCSVSNSNGDISTDKKEKISLDVAGKVTDLNNPSSDESLESQNQEETDDSEWIVYEPNDFDKNELCLVLTCQREELCLVRSNNAICGNSNQLDVIEGKKRFHKSSNNLRNGDQSDSIAAMDYKNAPSLSTDENTSQQQQWDQQKLRDKMTKYMNKLKAKKEKKMSREESNTVTVKKVIDENVRNEPMEKHERHSSRMGHYQNCSMNELNSIKGRLFQWFSDIHAIQKSEPGYELPEHKVVCNEDVGFMFFILDGDKDETLSVDELFSIDNDPHEKCVKSFLDRCDTDSDDKLSLDEWCDCFHWAGDDRHEPACHAALRKHDPHDPESFFPSCDTEGYYKLEQCHNKQCWCVDKWGREFDQSRTKKGAANCHKYVI